MKKTFLISATILLAIALLTIGGVAIYKMKLENELAIAKLSSESTQEHPSDQQASTSTPDSPQDVSAPMESHVSELQAEKVRENAASVNPDNFTCSGVPTLIGSGKRGKVCSLSIHVDPYGYISGTYTSQGQSTPISGTRSGDNYYVNGCYASGSAFEFSLVRRGNTLSGRFNATNPAPNYKVYEWTITMRVK